VIKTYERVESSTRGERKEFAAMLAFAQAQNETVAIVADAVDRFQRSFKESVLIDAVVAFVFGASAHVFGEVQLIGLCAHHREIQRRISVDEAPLPIIIPSRWKCSFTFSLRSIAMDCHSRSARTRRTITKCVWCSYVSTST
jgi:hypothetical protein